MDRKQVISSNIVSIGYDPAKLILEVEFKGGSIYQYIKVPPSIYKKLMAADSHGRYLESNIKKEGYAFKKIK